MLPSERLQMGRGFISYRRMGEGPPLLLLHGWGASSRYWLSTLPALADVRTGYAIDLPGFGESPAFRGTTSIPRLAAAVLAFADTLGLAQFDLNGHSFGASVAVYLAANYPDRVRRLGLTAFGIWQAGLTRTLLSLVQRPVEFVAGLWQPWLGLAQPLLNLWRPWAIAALSVPPIPQVLTRWFLEHPPEDENLLHEGIADMVQMDVRAHIAAVASVGAAEVLQALVAVQAPALVIGGRRDKVTPPDEMAAAAKMIPESRLVLLDHCGHVPMFEQPAAYHRALRAFLLEA
jgi:pimeloyl-ACP methyl ester carboxylesterase